MTLPSGPLERRFASAMARLGPFEPRPLLGVAVSGGADSLALVLLADCWARAAGGSVLGLIVDHGLRPASGMEAAATFDRLAARGIAAKCLTLMNLRPGPGLAERARASRYCVLIRACREAGCLHLLLGHHMADQAETLMMRALGNSRSAGLAAMPALRELPTIRLLRPLLSILPEDLRDFLHSQSMEWVEDPSNRDPRALRARLRPPARSAAADLAAAAAGAGRTRARAEEAVARVLAERVEMRPEGFAVLSPGRIVPDALSALLQTVAGAPFAPPSGAAEALAADPGSATLAGVQVLPAGRLGPGWLLVREAAAMQPAVAAADGTLWDGRFRLSGAIPDGMTLGALGADATCFRSRSGLPAAVLRTLPALRRGNTLVAVPHLSYCKEPDCARATMHFCPRRPLAGASFCPSVPA